MMTTRVQHSFERIVAAAFVPYVCRAQPVLLHGCNRMHAAFCSPVKKYPACKQTRRNSLSVNCFTDAYMLNKPESVKTSCLSTMQATVTAFDGAPTASGPDPSLIPCPHRGRTAHFEMSRSTVLSSNMLFVNNAGDSHSLWWCTDSFRARP